MADRPLRSTSPDPFSDPYDPFQSPLEMTNLRRPTDAQNTHNSRIPDSPGISPPISPVLSPQRSGINIQRGDVRSKQYVTVPGSALPQAGIRSEAPSLYSLNSLSQYRTMDPNAQRLAEVRAGELAEWRVHWITPAMIVGLFVAGIMGALGHHFFYVHLDGRPAEDQLKMVRYGTALAFFVKSTLVGCVIMCYRQRIWHTFRKKAMTINAIDGLFSSTEDPTQFFRNWEMITNGKLATFMAVCSWLIPIASVLSPASLTSEVKESYNITHCPSVPSLNFSHESKYNFREERQFAGSSLVYYNTTDKKGEREGWFDYYDQPSKNAKRLAVTSMYLRKPAQDPEASLQSCGERWNCTYSINFKAPGYKCDEVANTSQPDASSAPFNLSMLAPLGNYTYYTNVDLNDYKNPQVETGDDGTPAQGPPFPDSLGVFDSEPVLWIGHSLLKSDPYPKDSPFARWKTVHEPKIFKCVAHYTNYTFEIKFNDTIQTATRKQRDFLAPLINTTLTLNASDGNDLNASPSSNFVRPIDAELYKETASYHAMGAILRSFLRGYISFNESYFVTKSDISETRLMDMKTTYPINNLMDEIPGVFEDMLVTLLSEPHLAVADKVDIPCAKSRSVNVFVYHRQNLWVGYSLAVAATFGFIIVGAWAIFQNGVASDTLFSRILVTTRNPTLDRLSVGACLGGDPFPKELTKTKLRFGVLLEEDPREGPLGKVEHCTFGAAGEVKDIMKYGTYAGLKKWRKEAKEEVGDVSEKEALLGKNIKE